MTLSRLQLQGISSQARVFSMAFPKNYPFLVLILFPCSLCVLHALNYATCSTGNRNFMLHWTYSNNKLIFNKTCKATGYCAVRVTETFFFFFIARETHTEEKKKLHRMNKVIKRKKNSEFTHLQDNTTNIKLDYSSANSIYYCT